MTAPPFRFDEHTAECLVYTYKEGLLSTLAHDLKLRVTRFSGELTEAGTLSARFDAGSLQVVSAMRDGAEDPVLSADDRRKIERTLRTEVLLAERYPEIRFTSARIEPQGEGYLIEGTLQIRDRSRPVRLLSHPEGPRQVAEVVLHQPDFGIRPYTALLGALKLKPDVRVRISVPVP